MLVQNTLEQAIKASPRTRIYHKGMKELGVKELKKFLLRLEVKDNTSAGDVSGESIVSNFSNFSNF